MKRYSLILLFAAMTVLAWWLLGFQVLSPTERIYLLVPPVFLAAFLAFVPESGKKLREQAVPALVYLAVLVFACMVIYAVQINSVIHNDSAEAYFRVRYVLPLLAIVYFLVAMSLLVALPVRGLRWLCEVIDRRRSGRPADQAPGQITASVYSVIAIVLVLPLLLPYLLGVTYVHRFKVPNPMTPLEMAGRPYEDVTLRTEDGYTIRGWFLPHDTPSARTLMISHGLGANRSNFIAFHELGRALDANIFFFDFRGHGDSDGHTVTFGYWEKLDVLAAVKYLREERPEQAKELFALGISMGTSGLVRAAAELDPPLDGIILDSPFASAVELTDSVLGAFPSIIRPYLTAVGVPIASFHAGCDLNAVRPIDLVGQLRCPVLILHANHDALIPVEHARRMYEAAAEPKSLWIAETGPHGSAWSDRDQYIRRARAQLLGSGH